MTLPEVSAIVVCYRHERFVADCLEAVQSQTYPRLQVVVIDDCSPDRSMDVIHSFVRSRNLPWKLLRNESNMGVCRTINRALERASGTYVSIVAADDMWLPNKTHCQVRMLESLPESVGVVYSDAECMNETGRILNRLFIESEKGFDSPPTGWIKSVLLRGNFIPGMTTLIRRKCFDEVGVYDETLAFEDWDMWLRISDRYQFAFTPEITARYRIVASSLVRSKRVPILEDTIKLYEKWLVGDRNDVEFVRSRLAVLSLELYEAAGMRRLDLLQAALKHDRSPRTLAKAAATLCGLGPARFRTMRSRISSLSPRVDQGIES